MSGSKETITKPIPDHVLLDQWRQGSEEAFFQLYERYYDEAVVFGTSFTKSRYLAEDLVQEIVLRIREKVICNKGKPIENFKHYFFAATFHRYYDQYRRRRKHMIIEEPQDVIPIENLHPTDFEYDDLIDILVKSGTPKKTSEYVHL